MGYIIGMIILLVFSGAGVIVGRVVSHFGAASPEHTELDAENAAMYRTIGSITTWATVAVTFVVVLIVTLVASLHTVPAGHVGVVYTFGKITNQTGDGLVITAPWQSLKVATTQVQTLAFMDESRYNDLENKEDVRLAGAGLGSFSAETQNVYIDAIIRIKVQPGDVQGLYRTVGRNYVNKLIPGQIAQVFKDETVKYAAVDIAPNREAIRKAVEKRLDQELQRFSITVDALLIENIAFDVEFEDSILAKQQATQEALKQEQLVKAKQAEAQQKIETARGESERLRIEAEGQAEANRLLNESLTTQLIQYQTIQRLADNIQIALVPSGAGLLIDPTTLLGQVGPE